MHLKLLAIVCLSLALSRCCLGQEETCGLRTIVEAAEPVFPPIAKAAHVEGKVILIATFNSEGRVKETRIVSGPAMLQQPSVTYVQGWRANLSPGTMNCPVVISYKLRDEVPSSPWERKDAQHVEVYGQTVCLCDPAAELGKRRRWYWPF